MKLGYILEQSMCSLYRSTNLLSSKYNSTYSHNCPNNWQQKWVHPEWTCQSVSKVSIFCRGTIIIQHCLNPPGHGIHQSCTGCCWHPLPLLHNGITQLLELDTWRFSTFRLRMPHMCSIEFRSGDILGHSITFTFRSKAVSSRRFFGVVVMLENSFWRKGIIFFFRMSQYMLDPCFSMNRSSPVPAVVMQPQTMMLPPPLTVGKAQFSWYSSPGCRPHTGHHLSQTSLP